MASKYPSLSGYSYVGGNPLLSVDRNGQTIRFATGNTEGFDDVESVLNEYFNNNVTFSISTSTGYLEITGSNLSKLTEAQRKVYDYLNEQITSEKDIVGKIVPKDENALFDFYNYGTLDISDISQLKSSSEKMRLFVHFLGEQSQVIGTDPMKPTYDKAHANAVKNDFKVMGFSWSDAVLSDSEYRKKTGFEVDKNGKHKENRIIDSVTPNGAVIGTIKVGILENNVTNISNIDKGNAETQRQIKTFFSVPTTNNYDPR